MPRKLRRGGFVDAYASSRAEISTKEEFSELADCYVGFWHRAEGTMTMQAMLDFTDEEMEMFVAGKLEELKKKIDEELDKKD